MESHGGNAAPPGPEELRVVAIAIRRALAAGASAEPVSPEALAIASRLASPGQPSQWEALLRGPGRTEPSVSRPPAVHRPAFAPPNDGVPRVPYWNRCARDIRTLIVRDGDIRVDVLEAPLAPGVSLRERVRRCAAAGWPAAPAAPTDVLERRLPTLFLPDVLLHNAPWASSPPLARLTWQEVVAGSWAFGIPGRLATYVERCLARPTRQVEWFLRVAEDAERVVAAQFQLLAIGQDREELAARHRALRLELLRSARSARVRDPDLVSALELLAACQTVRHATLADLRATWEEAGHDPAEARRIRASYGEPPLAERALEAVLEAPAVGVLSTEDEALVAEYGELRWYLPRFAQGLLRLPGDPP